MEMDNRESGEDTKAREEREREAAERENREEESSFTEDRRRDDSMIIIDRSDPLFTRVDDVSTSDGPGGTIPNVGRDVGVMKRSMISDMKEFLKDGIGITVNKGAGESSKKLYDNLEFSTSKKTGAINGAKYRGKKILFMKGGKMEYSTAKDNGRYVKEFKELLRKADIEYQKSPESLVDKKAGVDVTKDTMDSIAENTRDRIVSEVDSTVEKIATDTEITENELREVRGLLVPKGRTVADKLKALEIERDNWKKKAEEEGDTRKGKLYETISEIADLKADELRLRLNQKPVTEKGITMLKEETDKNDLTRFEKFKKWSRENLVNLSALAISVAGIITTVVMAGRNVLKKGGDALRKFGKAVANVIKKVWPVLAPLGTLILKIFEFLGKGLLFLADNLWLLALATTYFIYNEYNIRYRRRSGKQ